MDQRVMRIDLIRAVSSASVVLLHSTSKIINNYKTVPDDGLLAALSISALTRWAVPVFLMVSGAIFLESHYKWEGAVVFWKKRLSKVIIPIIFWNFIYFWVFMRDGAGNHQWDKGIREFFTLSGTYYHLYYMMVALGLYAVTPLLRKWLSWVGKNWFWWWMGWLLAVNLYAVAYSWWGVYKITELPIMFIPYLGFFVLGAKIWRVKISKKILAAMLLEAALLITLGNYNLVYRYGVTLRGVFFFDRLTLPVLIEAIAVFVGLMGSLRFKNKLVAEIASCSFGIYLIHPLITDGLFRGLTYRGGAVGTVLWLFGFWAAAWGISFGAVQVLKRIKGLRAVVGS